MKYDNSIRKAKLEENKNKIINVAIKLFDENDMNNIAKLNNNSRRYIRTEEQLEQFLNFKITYEEEKNIPYFRG